MKLHALVELAAKFDAHKRLDLLPRHVFSLNYSQGFWKMVFAIHPSLPSSLAAHDIHW